jgi:NDP-sugar pyrophosphorylase family protein
MNPDLSIKDFNIKALILAGGRGKRLGEYTDEENKCMLNFGGKPLIEYSLQNAIKLSVKEIVIVVGYLAESIINYFGGSYKGTKIKYVIQKEQLGLVHAIECSKSAIGNSDFILFLGDEFLLEPNHKSLINLYLRENAFVVTGVIRTEDKKKISNTYSILFDEKTKQIFRLIEKPKNPLNTLMGTGNIVFNNKIFDYIDSTPINQQRKEKELPDLIQCAIDNGKKVLYYPLSSTYVNVNTPNDIIVIKEVTTNSESNGQ